ILGTRVQATNHPNHRRSSHRYSPLSTSRRDNREWRPEFYCQQRTNTRASSLCGFHFGPNDYRLFLSPSFRLILWDCYVADVTRLRTERRKISSSNSAPGGLPGTHLDQHIGMGIRLVPDPD